VEVGEDLDEQTRSNPEGTTFWLAPGVHTLSDDEFSQVIPKEGNTYVGAPGATLDGQQINRYAFTGGSTNVEISNLTIEHFGPRNTNQNEGVVNHDSAANWVIKGNTIRENAGAGVMVGSGNLLQENCLLRNGQYGFSAYHPVEVSDITIERNEIAENNEDDWEERIDGCGCTGGGKLWGVRGAIVSDNWFHHNRGPGIWGDTNNAGLAFQGNFVSDNEAEGLIYETSYNALIDGNTFARNGWVKGPTNPGFPTGAIYVSESGSDTRVETNFGESFEISRNAFVDNWSGVILWENSDRFAGSPANTSSGAGTLVNPEIVNADTCNSRNIDSEPFIDDCRWKTQNVQVHDNYFAFSPNEVGAACSSGSGCGFNGIFANWGTFPQWSPYQAETVQDAITFDQGNQFYENSYAGPWMFLVHEQGNQVDWPAWLGAPYSQDKDSIIRVTGAKGS
jgi:hypothetical protein